MNIERVKQLMKEKNISQSKLSEAVGVSQAFVSYMISGDKIPSLAVTKKMADLFGVLVDDLL